MTIEEWLATRNPAPPPRLGARLRDVLVGRLGGDASETPKACVDVACRLLRALADRPDARREAALDLLTVDALVTYAFEAIANDPERLEALARDSISRIAGLVSTAH